MITGRVFVYAIGSEDGPVKVGITTNLDSRLRSLQNGSATKLELIWVYTAEDRDEALKMERSFHECHNNIRLEGEWFNITAELAFESLKTQVEFMFDRSVECFTTGEPWCAQHLRKREQA